MADSPSNPEPRAEPGMPRWVKIFGIITVIVIALFLILMFVKGPGGHGPSRHFGNKAAAEAVMAASGRH